MSLKRRMCSRVIFVWRRDVPKTGNKTENSNLGAATEKWAQYVVEVLTYKEKITKYSN